MGDREPGPQRGAMATVEAVERLGVPFVKRGENPRANPPAGGGRAQALALQIQERDFIERVVGPERGTELEAIDDADRIAHPDVFGSKVAVRVEYPTPGDSLDD
jgi:hypothetical protein